MGQGYNAGFESWFVRDTSNKWYHPDNYPDICEELKNIVRDFDGRTVFIGSSMGGYGALLFGLHAMPSKVIAFSPQVETEYFETPLPEMYRAAKARPEIDIHICKTFNDCQWDDFGSAVKMEKYSRLSIHDCHGHASAEVLKDAGKIQDIIINA